MFNSDISVQLFRALQVFQINYDTGIPGNRDCTFNEEWTAFKCEHKDYKMLVVQSMDDDTETRRLSPTALIDRDGKYVDLNNGMLIFHSVQESNHIYSIHQYHQH